MALLMSGLDVRVILKARQVAGGPRCLFESFNKSAPPISSPFGTCFETNKFVKTSLKEPCSEETSSSELGGGVGLIPSLSLPITVPPRPPPRQFPLLAPPSLQKKKGGGGEG